MKKIIKHNLEAIGMLSPRVERPASIGFFSWSRYYHLAVLLDEVYKRFGNNTDNLHIAEAGIGYGDSFSILALFSENSGYSLIGFDSFKGFPEPSSPKDQRAFGKRTEKGQWNVNSPEAIRRKLINCGLSVQFIEEKVELIGGYFEDSLPNFSKDKKIALLNLDVDLYSSYKTCLDNLWCNIIPGGIVAFDEYQSDKWVGAKEAIDKFCVEKELQVHVNAVTGRAHLEKPY